MPADAYIVEAVRSPVGRRNGALSHVHPIDLGAHALAALVERSRVDPDAVEDVIWGCVDCIGPQAGDLGRSCWLAAGLPEHVPGVTIDRQCGSSQQALHFAAQAVMSGTQDLVVAGGSQHMSSLPLSSAMQAGREHGFHDPFSGSVGWWNRYGDQPVSQFHGAELLAEQWDISREEMESFALMSHQRAIAAIEDGRLDREIEPLGDVKRDEGPRRDTTVEKMAELPPLQEGGRLTAAVASQISDGSAALLVASERAIELHGLTPRARIVQLAVRGEDPIRMLSAPIPATRHALTKASMSLDEMDLIEVNEAFAPVVLGWANDLGADLERINVNGGAIALGHPLGATGARLMVTLLHELERRGGRYGLQTMCELGGQANVTIIERIQT